MFPTRAVLFVALIVALVQLPVTSAAQPPKWFSVSERGLVGSLGPLRIRMMISTYGEGEISGSYYVARDEPFARNWMTDITVRGTIDRAGHFRMAESAGESLDRPVDESEQPDELSPKHAAEPENPLDQFGVFAGTLTHGPPASRPTVRLEGTWTLPDGTNPVPFSLAEVPLPRELRIDPKSYQLSLRRPAIAAGASYPSIAGRPAFERTAMQEIRRSAGSLRRNADQDLEGVDPREVSTLDIDYEITYASPTTVSVLYRSHYWYTVFVTHDVLDQYGETYDYRRGRWITLRDIFGPDYYKDLAPMVRAAVKETYWEDMVRGAQDEIARADFYLVEGGVMLLFATDHGTGQVVEIFIPHMLP